MQCCAISRSVSSVLVSENVSVNINLVISLRPSDLFVMEFYLIWPIIIFLTSQISEPNLNNIILLAGESVHVWYTEVDKSHRIF